MNARSCLAAFVVATALVATAGIARAADAKHGSNVFDDECSDCHNATSGGGNGRGPNLYGVIGRHAGTVPGFAYSSANKSSGVVWTEPVLETYLDHPQAFMPGTAMRYKGLHDASDRADVIAFLATLH